MYVTQSINSTHSPDSRRVLKGGVSTTAPQPGLGSGSSPPSAARLSLAPKFGSSSVGWGNIIGPTALSQCFTDILGVWVPKNATIRSKTQFFEEAFLEFVEDAAFYFAVPVAGFALHKSLGKLAKLQNPDVAKVIGQGVASKTKDLSKELVAAKFGTLMGALALAGAGEYMIQHVKNVITAKQFNTKNFTAVAGLEDAQSHAVKGEMDPVVKAKRRSWQVPLLFGSLLAAALASPKMILHNPALEKGARKVLTYVDFGKNPFDISKAILGILAGIGAVSYIDASRDHLERKENATRLAVIIPYMLIGKEIVGYGLGKFYEKFGKVFDGAKNVHISDLKDIKLTNGNTPWHQFAQKETFMDAGVLTNLSERFKALAKEGRPVPQALQQSLGKVSKKISWGSYILSAAISGVGINLIAYHQTKERYKRQQQGQLQNQQTTATAPVAQWQTAPQLQKPQPVQPFTYAPAPAPSPFGYPAKPVNGFALPQFQKPVASPTQAPWFPATLGQRPVQWN